MELTDSQSETEKMLAEEKAESEKLHKDDE